MASILVIGVGSTGLAAMERAQQFYFEFTKQSSPVGNSAFLFLETDEARKPAVTSQGKTDIKACYLTPHQITATLAGWNGKYSWMPTKADVLSQHSGAAGQPAYGRIALWAEENAVRNQITKLYGVIGGDKDTNIYIVGSLTGGTGTGVFIDIAYMVRQITGNTNIYGMFMLPDNSHVGSETMGTLYENAYSSLRSLDKFAKPEKDEKTGADYNYQCALPGGTDISSLSAPFYNIQFFTPDFEGAQASLPSLEQLVQTVGFNLVLRMIDVNNIAAPFQALVNARLVDYTMHVPDGINTAIGLNVYQYPEALLEEYLTTSLIKEDMLDRWADTSYYIDKLGTKVSIETQKVKIKTGATRFVHDALESAIEKCMGGAMLGKSTFHTALQGEIEAIITGNYQAPSAENYIFSLFDSNSNAPKFYAAISGQASLLRDELIRLITEKIMDESTVSQNLEITKHWINGIVDALDAIPVEWKRRFRIDGEASSWNNSWKQMFDLRLKKGKGIYFLTGCKKEWYEEALMGVAYLCYFNTLIREIAKITDAMLNRNGSGKLQTATGIKLPTIKTWEEIYGKIQTLLDATNQVSLVARKESLRGQMTQGKNPQINFLFQSSFEEDIQGAQGRYKAIGNPLTYDKISSDKLWQFLLDRDLTILKSTMIANGLIHIQSLSLFGTTDIVQIMKNLPNSHPLYSKVHNVLTGTVDNIRKDTPAMAKLITTEQFEGHICLKLIVAAPTADTVADGIVASMKGYTPSLADSNFVHMPSLKNTVVIYQEYAYLGGGKTYNPLVHLAYQNQVLNSINTKINNKRFDTSVRLAYIDQQTLVDINNVKIK